MQAFRKAVGMGFKAHVVTGEAHRLGSEFVGKRHRHPVDRLTGGLFTDAHDDTGSARAQRVDVGTIEGERHHTVGEPVLEISADAGKRLGGLGRQVELRRCFVLLGSVRQPVVGEEFSHCGVDTLATIGVVEALGGGHLLRRVG